MAGPNALNELRTSTKLASPPKSDAETKSLSEIGKGPVTVIKHPSAADSEKEETEQEFKLSSVKGDEFMTSSDSEFGTFSGTKLPGKPSASQSSNKLEVEADKLLSGELSTPTHAKSSSDTLPAPINTTSEKTATNTTQAVNNANETEDIANEEPAVAEVDEDEEEKSAAELVAAAAAQIANKTIKKPNTTASGAKTLKSTGKLLMASGKQEQIMKKAMLMLNESGKLNVVTEETGPSIIKLNTPVNKAQIKLRSFRQNFEKQLAEMRRKTPMQIQLLKSELANIEFAEIGNKNIIAGLLELVDDHELKLLTIEKMLKHGDITLSF